MFGIKKQDKLGETITFQISGMHCASCAMNIDGQLEDMSGVIESHTSYPKAETKVTYDAGQININQIQKVILKTGYEAKIKPE